MKRYRLKTFHFNYATSIKKDLLFLQQQDQLRWLQRFSNFEKIYVAARKNIVSQQNWDMPETPKNGDHRS
jgi:hypothetical protein